MLRDKILRVWIKKLVYGWLIFCVGGVSSLTYFDGLLPGHEHDQHPYHLSIFEESSHTHQHGSSPPETEVEQIRFWLVSRLNPQTDFILATQNLGPGLSQFFTSGLSDGYILTIAQLNIFALPPLLGSIALAALSKQSVSLAPLDKPPSLQLN
ncbi:MAG: hypothetical protein DPW09_15035 [Anaerolineae bacterium]|nr:hypothetical protein [Anaerolineales bacterium]MCQ3974754.1 hypothetical protein [Anaerolineae bacterium]